MKNQSILKGVLAGLSMTLAVPAAMAQNEKGNGGHVVVCYKDQRKDPSAIDYVELVDYIEAAGTRWKMDLGTDNPGVDDVDAMLEVALTRLERLDASRAQKIRQQIAEMRTNMGFIDLIKDRREIEKLNDANILIKHLDSPLCERKMAAFNRVNPELNEYKYVYIRQYYDKLINDTHRAGLILHETIYNMEAANKAENSDESRKLVRLVSSREIEKITQAEYYAFIKNNSKKPTVTAQNGVFTSVTSWLDGNTVERGTLVAKQIYGQFFLDISQGGEKKTILINSQVEVSGETQYKFLGNNQAVPHNPHHFQMGMFEVYPTQDYLSGMWQDNPQNNKTRMRTLKVKEYYLRNEFDSSVWTANINWDTKKIENLYSQQYIGTYAPQKTVITTSSGKKIEVKTECQQYNAYLKSGYIHLNMKLTEDQNNIASLTFITPKINDTDCTIQVSGPDQWGTQSFEIKSRYIPSNPFKKRFYDSLKLEFDAGGDLDKVVNIRTNY